MSERKAVTIYTDGACLGNPGPGGYGAVVLVDGQRKELSGGFRRTTNNRMELMAALEALNVLKEPGDVLLYSDSQYLVKAMEQGWAQRWRANGWMRTAKDRAINPDLWKQLLVLCERHQVRFAWVQGHAGNPENERCDRLSVQAAHGNHLAIDEGFERSLTKKPALFDLLDT